MTDPNNKPLHTRHGEVLAWALYDWANSAYSTISITFLVAYLEQIVLPGKWGKVVWAWGIAVSMLVAAVLSPIVGAMADARRNKRSWLAATALGGAAAAVIMAALPPTCACAIVALFVLAALGFELSLAFYNGFLPEIADEESMNRVSAWGFALGYLGGALALVAAIGLKMIGPHIGLPEAADQVRAGLAVMGLWWGLFTLPTLWVLRDRGERPTDRVSTRRLVATAVGEVGKTLRSVRRYQMLALFLLGFLLYNDGIETVLSQASTFAINELDFGMDELVYLILLIQFAALPGAMLVGWLADRFGQKPILMGCLAVWVGLVTTAFFVTTKPQFWVLGGVLALVMGGTQSVSRAVMGRMTPAARTAEFFGFFNLSGKATSFGGTFLFGAIIFVCNSARWAILSLIVFFVAGWAVTAYVNIERGRREAAE
jgi:MFS transporter, UMF1 family